MTIKRISPMKSGFADEHFAEGVTETGIYHIPAKHRWELWYVDEENKIKELAGIAFTQDDSEKLWIDFCVSAELKMESVWEFEQDETIH